MLEKLLQEIIAGCSDSNLLPVWLQAFAAILAALAAFIAVVFIPYQLWRDHRWNKMQHTLSIIGNWTDIIVKYSKVIKKKIPDYYITKEEAEDFRNAKDEATMELKEAAVIILNHLEFICVAHKRNVLNKSVFNEQLGPNIAFWYDHLKEYIEAENRYYGRDVFPQLKGVTETYGQKTTSLSL